MIVKTLPRKKRSKKKGAFPVFARWNSEWSWYCQNSVGYLVLKVLDVGCMGAVRIMGKIKQKNIVGLVPTVSMYESIVHIVSLPNGITWDLDTRLKVYQTE